MHRAATGGADSPEAERTATVTQTYRQLKVEDALAYLDKVRMKFDKQPHIYNRAHWTLVTASQRVES